ncbi:MAG: FRG domain-containing protein [Stenotrophobium sp.]
MLTWTPPSSNAKQNARDILSAAMWIHTTFQNEIWLWRGQALGIYGIEPGMHTRVLNATNFPHTEDTVERATERLLKISREARLDRQGETRLPDLAMLAHLQHYGAGTPLLDVSTDPLIALWMIAFANAKKPHSLDEESGMLFGIRKPPSERWISPLDARPYSSQSAPSISKSLGNHVWWYQAPDVTERLRIQRGSFLLGSLSNPKARNESTIPLELDQLQEDWLAKRMEKRGQPSNTTQARSEAFGIVVRGSAKKHLRTLLEERSGLSVEAVYPTPWHRPFISQFAEGYGRTRKLELDIAPPAAAGVKLKSVAKRR